MIWDPVAECLPRADRGRLVLERLRDRVAWAAARVPFDGRALAGAGVTPERIRSLEDLARLPFTREVEPTADLVAGWGGFDPARKPVRALRARAAERVRAPLGLNPEIDIVPLRSIPRSEGKAVRVVERSTP